MIVKINQIYWFIQQDYTLDSGRKIYSIKSNHFLNLTINFV